MRARPLLVSAASLAVVSGVVLQSSTAAFTATTGTTGGWAAGTISLSDNDSGSALFAETDLAPGATGAKCIKVVYTGATAATLRLYAQIPPPASGRVGGLGDYLSLTIVRGSGSNASCGDFVAATSDSAVYGQGLLSAMARDHRDYATGVGSVSVTSTTPQTYRIAWALSNDSAAQGKDVDASFTWEARTA